MTLKQNKGCGCSSIPFSLIIAIAGGSYWWLINQGHLKDLSKFLPEKIEITNSIAKPSPSPSAISVELPTPVTTPSQPITVAKSPTPTPSIAKKPTLWDKKVIRGIYYKSLSNYQ
jgi:hypothetical protein